MLRPASKKNIDDDYLSEFRQKIATQREEELEERRKDLHQARNGFIGTVAGIVLAGIIGWVVLMPHFINSQSGEIPVIRRPLTPVKVQPSEPGGMEILNQDKSIYDLVEKKEVEQAKVESLLPQPENPKMPTIVPEPEVTEEVEEPVSTVVEPVAEKTSDLPPAKAMEELLEEVQSNATETIKIPEKPKNLNVEVRTVSAEAVAPVVQKEVSVPEKAQKSAESVSVVEKKVVETASETTAPAGVWQIQLFASANKSAVEKARTELNKKYPVLAPLPYEIEAGKTDSGALLYRLKSGAFSDRASADSVCGKVKQAGGTCWVKKK